MRAIVEGGVTSDAQRTQLRQGPVVAQHQAGADAAFNERNGVAAGVQRCTAAGLQRQRVGIDGAARLLQRAIADEAGLRSLDVRSHCQGAAPGIGHQRIGDDHAPHVERDRTAARRHTRQQVDLRSLQGAGVDQHRTRPQRGIIHGIDDVVAHARGRIVGRHHPVRSDQADVATLDGAVVANGRPCQQHRAAIGIDLAMVQHRRARMCATPEIVDGNVRVL